MSQEFAFLTRSSPVVTLVWGLHLRTLGYLYKSKATSLFFIMLLLSEVDE